MFKPRKSDLSVKIAEYVEQHGERTVVRGSKPDCPVTRFEVKKELEDGRELCIVYKSSYYGAKEKRLLFRLEPIKGDQFGYQFWESNLSGKFNDFRVLFGTTISAYIDRRTILLATKKDLLEMCRELEWQAYNHLTST